jgi:hypothetical protein
MSNSFIVFTNHETKRFIIIDTTVSLRDHSPIAVFISDSRLALYQELETESIVLDYELTTILGLVGEHVPGDATPDTVQLPPLRVRTIPFATESHLHRMEHDTGTQSSQNFKGTGRKGSDCSPILIHMTTDGAAAEADDNIRFAHHSLTHIFDTSCASEEQHRRFYDLEFGRFAMQSNPVLCATPGGYGFIVGFEIDAHEGAFASLYMIAFPTDQKNEPLERVVELPEYLKLSNLLEVQFDHADGVIYLLMDDYETIWILNVV